MLPTILASIIAASAYGQTVKIKLIEVDQSRLTQELSKIDQRYKTEELVDKDLPTWHVVKKYNFGDSHSPFYIHCSEEFRGGSTYGSLQGIFIMRLETELI